MKKYVVAVLGLTLALSLAGCGADKDGNIGSIESSASDVITEISSEASSVVEDITNDSTEASGSEDASTQTPAGQGGAADVLNAVWNGFSEDGKFPAWGGVMSDPVDGAAGNIDLADTDNLSYTLLVPEALHGSVTGGASLIHFMNANTFTGAALQISGADADSFIADLEDAIMNNQFMCGMPERLVIVQYEDYVIYAFGVDDIVTEFEANALANLEGAKTQVNEVF